MHNVRKILICVPVVILVLALSIFAANAESVGTVTADILNFRESPNTYSEIITQLYYGDQVTVTGSAEGWYSVSYGDMSGWVSGQYLTVEDDSAAYGIISGDSVNIRSGPGTWYEAFTQQNWGDRVIIIGNDNDWYNVQLADGSVGWVINTYLSEGTSRADDTASQIIAFSKSFLGVGYVYGGSSSYGFDCSGFTKYVFDNFGIYIERVAADQAQQGIWVDRYDLRRGDLVFFDTDGGSNYINHAGIYLGNGEFIHASSGSGGVVISSLSSGFYNDTYMAARRFFR